MQALGVEIERVRNILTRCYAGSGRVDRETLALSHHLDNLINQYQRLQVREALMKELRVAASM